MAKVLKTSTDKIIFGTVGKNEQSSIFEFILTNGDIEGFNITKIQFPDHVFGRLKGTSGFTSVISDVFELPQRFITSQHYFMKPNGKIGDDETETGIFLGIGNIDNNLDVNIQIGLQDELGFILEDETGNYLEDV